VADLYPVVKNSWERIRSPLPAPRAHAYAHAPLDAEVRTFLPPIPLEEARLKTFKLSEAEVLAVGCGDVDEDGGVEIVTVSKARVSIGKLVKGRFVATET